MLKQQAMPRKSRNQTKFNRIWLYSLLGVGAVILLIAAYYVYSILSFTKQIHENSETNNMLDHRRLHEEPAHEPPEWDGKEKVNILLLGGDARGNRSRPLSDSNILVSIDPERQSAKLYSVLRDTYVDVPGYGKNRINTALAFGGPGLAMETVGQLTGLNVQYYVYVDFEGFIALIDAIGGIDVDIEKNMRRIDRADDPRYNIDLKKGEQHLDGLQALQYVRFRSDAKSDFGRSERQRKFVSSVAAKMKSTTTLVQLPKVLNSIAPYLETNIEPHEMLKLARLGMRIDLGQMSDVQIPPAGMFKPQRIDGNDVLVIDPEQIKQYINEQ